MVALDVPGVKWMYAVEGGRMNARGRMPAAVVASPECFPVSVDQLQGGVLDCAALPQSCAAASDNAIKRLPELLRLVDRASLDLRMHMRTRAIFVNWGDPGFDPQLDHVAARLEHLKQDLRRVGDLFLAEVLVENPEAVRHFLCELSRTNWRRRLAYLGLSEFASPTEVMRLPLPQLGKELGKVIRAIDEDEKRLPGGYATVLRAISSTGSSVVTFDDSE